jgi:hypothetical protein
MRSALQDRSVPDVHSTLILFLLNFFKMTITQPKDLKRLGKGLYSCFFGETSTHNDNVESGDIVAFMIIYAGEILANVQDINDADHQGFGSFLPRRHSPNPIATTFGEILANIQDVNDVDHQGFGSFLPRRHSPNPIATTFPGQVAPGDRKPLLRKSLVTLLLRRHSPNTIATTSPERVASKGSELLLEKSLVRQTPELMAQSAPEDDGTGTADAYPQIELPHHGSSFQRTKHSGWLLKMRAHPGSRRYAIMIRLHDQGYTNDDFTKYMKYINNYVEQDSKFFQCYRKHNCLSQQGAVATAMFSSLLSG